MCQLSNDTHHAQPAPTLSHTGQAREGWAASTAPAAASASPGDSPPASPRRGAAAVQRGVLRGRLLLELPSGAKGVGGASPPRAAMQVSGRRPGQDRSAPAQGSAAFLSSGREGRAPAAQGPPGHAQQHTVLSVSTVPMSGTDVAVGNARVEAKQAPWPAQQTHGHAHASTTGDVQGRGQAPRDTAGAGPSFRTLVMSGVSDAGGFGLAMGGALSGCVQYGWPCTCRATTSSTVACTGRVLGEKERLTDCRHDWHAGGLLASHGGRLCAAAGRRGRGRRRRLCTGRLFGQRGRLPTPRLR